MSDLDLYRFNAEDEKIRYVFYYTYEEPISDVITKLETLIGPVHVYDVFPGANTYDITLDEPLSVITTIGTEMILAPKTIVTVFEMGTILFGEKQDP